MTARISTAVDRPPPVEIVVDGRRLSVPRGEMLAAAMMAAGFSRFRSSPRGNTPRGPLCLMGACQECLVRVNGRLVTACTEPVVAAMTVAIDPAR